MVFTPDKALLPVPVTVPCGRCIGCRLDRSLDWAVRCVHESKMHDFNCFITLTFDDKHLDEHRSLKVRDFQIFMKKFRRFVHPVRIRFFHCGEYGSKFGRPHHHACIFGYDFPDKKLLKKFGDVSIYSSDILSNLWGYGFCTVGDVTFKSAAYVARYVLKKWCSDDITADQLYQYMKAHSDSRRRIIKKSDVNDSFKKDFYNGLKPEYITMSRKPGIGATFFEKFKSDMYPSGSVILPSGNLIPTPKYYDNLFSLDNSFEMAMMKCERIARSLSSPDNSKARLEVREEVKKANLNNSKRSFENGAECYLNP